MSLRLFSGILKKLHFYILCVNIRFTHHIVFLY
nr:MAG TPA: hypothetical protein [Caudoviricetes sp.]